MCDNERGATSFSSDRVESSQEPYHHEEPTVLDDELQDDNEQLTSYDPTIELFKAVLERKPRGVLLQWIARGADINHIRTKHVPAGRSALCYAVSRNDQETVRNLIELDADVNLVFEDGETALTVAVKNVYDGTDMVRWLLSFGADPGPAEKLDLNLTMRYWVDQARLFPIFREQMSFLKPVNLHGLPRISFFVVGQRIAVRQLRRSVRGPFRGRILLAGIFPYFSAMSI